MLANRKRLVFWCIILVACCALAMVLVYRVTSMRHARIGELDMRRLLPKWTVRLTLGTSEAELRQNMPRLFDEVAWRDASGEQSYVSDSDHASGETGQELLLGMKDGRVTFWHFGGPRDPMAEDVSAYESALREFTSRVIAELGKGYELSFRKPSSEYAGMEHTVLTWRTDTSVAVLAFLAPYRMKNTRGGYTLTVYARTSALGRGIGDELWYYYQDATLEKEARAWLNHR